MPFGNVIFHKNNEQTTDFRDQKALQAMLGIQPHQDAYGQWVTNNSTSGASSVPNKTTVDPNAANLKAAIPDEAERKAFVESINAASPQELLSWQKDATKIPDAVKTGSDQFAAAYPVEKAKDWSKLNTIASWAIPIAAASGFMMPAEGGSVGGAGGSTGGGAARMGGTAVERAAGSDLGGTLSAGTRGAFTGGAGAAVPAAGVATGGGSGVAGGAVSGGSSGLNIGKVLPALLGGIGAFSAKEDTGDGETQYANKYMTPDQKKIEQMLTDFILKRQTPIFRTFGQYKESMTPEQRSLYSMTGAKA